MMLAATRFLQLMIGAFVVGSMFAVWAGYDPRGYSYATYVEQHHNVVRGLNVLIPALQRSPLYLPCSPHGSSVLGEVNYCSC
jgi:hypothetical protein